MNQETMSILVGLLCLIVGIGGTALIAYLKNRGMLGDKQVTQITDFKKIVIVVVKIAKRFDSKFKGEIELVESIAVQLLDYIVLVTQSEHTMPTEQELLFFAVNLAENYMELGDAEEELLADIVNIVYELSK